VGGGGGDAFVRAVADFAGSQGLHLFATATTAFVGIYCDLNWMTYRRARMDAEGEIDKRSKK
jgi:uncharacterized RmlC-like cupin family protein